MSLTLLSLLHLEGEVEGPDGEVHGLGKLLAHGAQQVEDTPTFLAHQARQQLWYPWQPMVGCDAVVVLVHSLDRITRSLGKQ